MAEPEVPVFVSYLWRWFQELHAARQSSGFGVSVITYRDIEAWSNVTGVRLCPWEIDVIKAIDQEWLEAMATSDKNKAQRTEQSKGQGRGRSR